MRLIEGLELNASVNNWVARTLLGLFASFAAMSCTGDFSTYPMPDSFEYFRYEGGRIVEKAVIRDGDPAYEVLRTIVSSRANGWGADISNYAPALSFQSKDMIINCRDDLVIINFRRNRTDSMRQLTSHFSGCRTKVLNAFRGEGHERSQ